MNLLWVAFLTGLTTGGISCVAVQGGLLASSISSETGDQGASRGRSVLAFLVAKLVGYTALGYFLGLLGATLILTPKMMGTLQIAAGLFMLWAAARVINLHPLFRYGVFQPPRWVYRLLKGKAPAALGFLTVLMPCGVTQATMAMAVASSNPWMGAGIMGAFVLGTSPIFFILGASLVGLLKTRAFSFVAAAVVFIFALMSINGGLGLRGSLYTFQNLLRVAAMSPEELALGRSDVAGVSDGVQQVTVHVQTNGYRTSVSTLKAGVPVRLKLVTNNTQGCVRAFTVPELNISQTLPQTGTETIEFTPKKTGRLAYSCGMGMYTGSFTVVN